jgi:DNA-binding LacI/PurR family transcriptional regulator
MATHYLLDLGHREILFLAGPHGSSSSAGRFIGYQRAMKASTTGYNDARVYMGGSDIESGKVAMSQVLSEGVSFTAVVAFNDQVALGAIDVLYQQGFHVPKDVSVLGFGDGLLAAYHRVPLTTVRIPQVDQGVAAVHLLENLIHGRPAQPRELPVELVIRQSCARPKTLIANPANS